MKIIMNDEQPKRFKAFKVGYGLNNFLTDLSTVALIVAMFGGLYMVSSTAVERIPEKLPTPTSIETVIN